MLRALMTFESSAKYIRALGLTKLAHSSGHPLLGMYNKFFLTEHFGLSL